MYASDDAVYEEFLAQPATYALHTLIQEHAPDLILFATTYASRDVAGRLQAKTGTALMSNAIDVTGPDRARTQIAGGTLFVDVELQGPAPQLVLVPPEVLRRGGRRRHGRGRPRRRGGPRRAPHGPACRASRGVGLGTRSWRRPRSSSPAGAGSRMRANFALLDQLAGVLGNAAVGASRAVVDAGWVPYSYQVGQTGKTVKPDVYIAVGISGALQHVVGMKGAKRIVAINKDPDAAVFRLADLGVVADALQFLPALIDEVRSRKGA